MTEEQGWDEANEHHDNPFAELDEEDEYPRTQDPEVIGDLTYRLSPVAAALGEGEPDVWPGLTQEEAAQALFGNVRSLLGRDGEGPDLPTMRRGLSGVVTDGPYRGMGGLSTFQVAAPPYQDLAATVAPLKQIVSEEEWSPVGSFGEFHEEYQRLAALFELTLQARGQSVTVDRMLSRLARALELAKRMHALHERMSAAVIDFGDTRYVTICVRKGSDLTADGSWLDQNFPGWRERIGRELWPGTHYVSPQEGSTLCGLLVGKVPADRRTDRFQETSCATCKGVYVELFGPDEEG